MSHSGAELSLVPDGLPGVVERGCHCLPWIVLRARSASIILDLVNVPVVPFCDAIYKTGDCNTTPQHTPQHTATRRTVVNIHGSSGFASMLLLSIPESGHADGVRSGTMDYVMGRASRAAPPGPSSGSSSGDES